MASSVVMSPDSFSITYEPIEDKIKQSVEKLERHIDQLEEDIQFFNEERIRQANTITILECQLNDKATEIKNLQDRERFLSSYTSYLEGRIAALEEEKNKNETT